MTDIIIKERPLKKQGWALGWSAGFTMMEMLVALAILSIAFGSIYKTFEQLNRSTATENVKAGTQQAVRIAVDFMVQDIRLAGLNPLGSPGIGIQAISQQSIQLTMDANFDGDDADTFEDIIYAYNSATGTLMQTNHLGAEVLIDNITDLNFIYLNSDDQTLDPTDQSAANRAAIRSVIISLTMQRPAGRDPDISRTYTTRVRCRNL